MDLLRTIMRPPLKFAFRVLLVTKRTDFELIGRTQLSRQTAEMKFVALLLLPIAASSGSSASDGPQDQVQLTQAVGQPTGARSLRGRGKRRPCAKSIATYCTTAKSAAR